MTNTRAGYGVRYLYECAAPVADDAQDTEGQ